MDVALRQAMSRDDFFAWAQRQEGRYEFDGFQPVDRTGGNLRHAALIRNVNRHLANRLAGKPCQAFGSEAGVATLGDAVRYPDAVVTCSPFHGGELLTPDPVVVFEVVSPSSVRRDRVTKLREYQAVPSIVRYVIVEPDQIAVTVHTRPPGRGAFSVAGLSEGDVLDMPEIGVGLPLAEIYADIAFDEAAV